MGTEKNILYLTEGLLTRRDDFKKARKYNQFETLQKLSEKFRETYSLDIKAQTNRDTGDLKAISKNMILSGFPFTANKPFSVDLNQAITEGVPTFLITDCDMPCDFIQISSDFEKTQKFRISCIKRDIAVKELPSEVRENEEALFKWDEGRPCFKGFQSGENKHPYPKSTRFSFNPESKPCNLIYTPDNKDIDHEWCHDLSATIGAIYNCGLPMVKKTKKIPIFHLSTFFDIAVWLYWMGDDILDFRRKKEEQKIKEETWYQAQKIFSLISNPTQTPAG